jgi:Glycosyl hydrolase family 12
VNSDDCPSLGRLTGRPGLRLALVMLTLVAALAGLVPAAATVGGGGGTAVTICSQLGHVTVRSRHGVVSVVRNDNFGGQPECLAVGYKGPHFLVSRQAVRYRHREPIAFPDVFMGCAWGVCTAGGQMPARVSALRDPATSWQTSLHATGTWNAAYDIWFAKHDMTTNQADGAELMIWLSTHGMGPARARILTIDHTRWYLFHWIASQSGVSWNYIQFRRVHPVTGVTDLKLAPFIRAAERLGWVRPSWWLLNIEAGFEIWNGGQGLATKSFWARA